MNRIKEKVLCSHMTEPVTSSHVTTAFFLFAAQQLKSEWSWIDPGNSSALQHDRIAYAFQFIHLAITKLNLDREKFSLTVLFFWLIAYSAFE